MNAQQPDRRVVVGVDGSENSIDALRCAADFARLLGARLELVATWTFQPTGADVFIERGYFEGHARSGLEHAAHEVFDDDPPEGITLRVEQGNAAKVLIDASEGAELLVVGGRGRGGFPELLLGSVSEACARHAHCPVLVVPYRAGGA